MNVANKTIFLDIAGLGHCFDNPLTAATSVIRGIHGFNFAWNIKWVKNREYNGENIILFRKKYT